MTVQACPNGYPRLAAFLDSDENFMVFRRFGFIQARLLLDKQNELQNLEEQLEEEDSRTPQRFLHNGEVGSQEPSERKKLLRNIETKFNEYGKTIAIINWKRLLNICSPLAQISSGHGGYAPPN